jgi:hypothetical protein
LSSRCSQELVVVPAKTRPNMASPWAALSSSWRQRRPLEGQGGKGAREKNTRAQEEQKRKCSRTGGGEKGSPSAREKRRKDLACAARLCSLHRLAAPRLPLAPACVRSPLFLYSAPTSSLLCAFPCRCALFPSPCCQGLKARGDPDSSLPGIAMCLYAQRLMLNVIVVKDSRC